MTDRMRIGAAYYAEYVGFDRLDTDLDLMVRAGFRVIRVGESVWSTWEPRDGELNLEWLRPVLDGAHARGIDVILGTPTYAIPPWLATADPTVLAQRGTGDTVGYGGRQNADITHPGYRERAERVIRAVVSTYAEHPAVIGWQVDNEPGAVLLHNDGVFARFRDELAKRYGTVEELNEQWGLTYWSHRLSSWDELWRPDFNTTPSYDLAWREFQHELITEFIGWQTQIVAEYARPGQFITTCIANGQPAADAYGLAQVIGRTAVNLYYGVQDALDAAPAERPVQGAPWWETHNGGAWRLYQQADTARGYRDEPFLVTETNAMSTGASEVNNAPYPGQWILAGLTMVSRGARLVEYWHWNTLRFGAETYWGGILDHRLRPGRCFAELSELAEVVARAEPVLADLIAAEDVLLVTSHSSRRALQFQPPLVKPGNTAPDPESYDRIIDAFYEPFHRVGAQLAVLDSRALHDFVSTADSAAPAKSAPGGNTEGGNTEGGLAHGGSAASAAERMVRRWPVVVAAGLYAATDEDLDLLLAYAQAGGHLVLGPRTGYADEQARARRDTHPLLAASGVDYAESANLQRAVPTDHGDATAWCDGLQPTDEQTYSAGPLSAPVLRRVRRRGHSRGRHRLDHHRRHSARSRAGPTRRHAGPAHRWSEHCRQHRASCAQPGQDQHRSNRALVRQLGLGTCNGRRARSARLARRAH